MLCWCKTVAAVGPKDVRKALTLVRPLCRPVLILLTLAALCCGSSSASTLVATAADPAKHDEAFIGALESLLAAAMEKEPVRPIVFTLS